ncbi:unnamed protein product [Wuchereria bancrofti]|uniref:Uncharacterized protein n=1 Tax=Wuchereria bancrofti TaxID=6293 RepID=A0A3P7E8T7_WUCBA|nr:unnamed protein product [Wuchereria bancrofti]
MRSEPAEFNSRESSYPMAASELMRACAGELKFNLVNLLDLVRILEPTRQIPYITAPSRSRLGSVEVETISSPIRISERSMSLTKPSFEFDIPLSPFEQTLQNQAFQLRRISTICDNDNDGGDSNNPVVQNSSTIDKTMQIPVYDHSRYPSVEGSSLTSNFTAAVAAAAQPRHERYAAHIPVTRIDGNGRQSTTSIDSHNRLVDELFKVFME